MATGGPVEEVNIRGRGFSVAADADGNRHLGGFTNEIEANGDGTARDIKTRVPWSLSGLTLVIDDDRGDQEFLQDSADLPGFWPIAFTFASGLVYQGSGQIVGDATDSTASTVAAIDFKGPGRLTKQ